MLRVKYLLRKPLAASEPGRCNCLLKTQHSANTKVDVWGVMPASAGRLIDGVGESEALDQSPGKRRP